MKIEELSQKVEELESRLECVEKNQGYVAYVEDKVNVVKKRLAKNKDRMIILSRLAVANLVLEGFVAILLVAMVR